MKTRWHFSNLLSKVAFLLIMAVGITACTSAKKLYYLNNLPDSMIVHLPPTVQEERVIEKGDQLDIVFSASDQEAANPFNKQTSNTGTVPTGTTVQPAGYVVDLDGFVELPVIGKIKVTGLTARQLKARLATAVGPYLKYPTIEVKFTTFRITVLGEVRGPGSFNLPTQRTTLFEGLAAAGDLPFSAKRYNVHLYRDYNGQRTITKIDLRDKALLYNPNIFQLKPNDVLYVQARSGSIFRDDFSLFTTIVTLLVSVVTLGFAISN